jgi:hypothetical protein
MCHGRQVPTGGGRRVGGGLQLKAEIKALSNYDGVRLRMTGCDGESERAYAGKWVCVYDIVSKPVCKRLCLSRSTTPPLNF